MGRGIVIALALSLAANVFLGGFVAGKFAGGAHSPGMPHMFAFRYAPEEFSDLTPTARESLRRAFVEHRAGSREEFSEVRKLHEEFVKVLGADVYDRAAAEALVAKFEAAESSGRADMARILVEAAEGLSTKDRKSLASHLEKRRGHWKGRRGHRPDGPLPEGPPKEGPPTEKD